MREEILKQLRVITPEEQEYLEGRQSIDTKLYMQEQDKGMNAVIDSSKLIDFTKLINIRPHTRFVHFPKHTHNYIEVIYMCSGQTHHVINGEDVFLQSGELLFLNQTASQEIYAAKAEDIAVNFMILPAFFDSALEMMGNTQSPLREFLIGCLRNEDSGISYLHFQVNDVVPVQNLVENLIWSILKQRDADQSYKDCDQMTMGLLFLELMNYTECMVTGKGQEDDVLVFTVLRYIEAHFENAQLQDLAEELHYDLYWLSRMIKKKTGKTFKDLLQEKRLHQAAFYLKNTKMSVSDVGQAIGYDNLSYFHKIFKNKYGYSPKQFRDCK